MGVQGAIQFAARHEDLLRRSQLLINLEHMDGREVIAAADGSLAFTGRAEPQHVQMSGDFRTRQAVLTAVDLEAPRAAYLDINELPATDIAGYLVREDGSRRPLRFVSFNSVPLYLLDDQDTPDKIDGPRLAATARFVTRIIEEFNERAPRPSTERQATLTATSALALYPNLPLQLQLYERVPARPSGAVVLLIHGASAGAEPTFDLDPERSWMRYLADRGVHTFALDLTGYGRSTRPPAMSNLCNLSAADQRALGLTPCAGDVEATFLTSAETTPETFTPRLNTSAASTATRKSHC